MDIKKIWEVFEFLGVGWEELPIDKNTTMLETNLEIREGAYYNKEVRVYYNTKTDKAIKHYNKIEDLKERIAELTEELKELEKDNQ